MSQHQPVTRSKAAAAAQKPSQKPSSEASEGKSEQDKYRDARKYLNNYGYLKDSDTFSVASMTKALADILRAQSQTDIQSRLGKAVAHVISVASNTEAKCQSCEKLATLPDMIDELRVDIQTDLDAKIDKLSKSLEEKLTALPKDAPGTSDKMEEAAKNLTKLAEGLEAKINKVTDTTQQPVNAATPYRNALASNPMLSAVTSRKQRQVLVQLTEADLATLSQDAILDKATKAIEKITDPPPPAEGVKILGVTKLRKGAILLLFNSKEAAEWIQHSEVELEFTIEFHNGSTIKPRQYALLAPRVPLTFDPDNGTHLREIEETNNLSENIIAKARWIKPVYRRKPEQKVAHATIIINDAKEANKCINEGLIICGVKVYPSKLKQEPTQCMKCRKWGHFAAECPDTKDTCGTCGNDHRTNTCSETSGKFCASCNSHTHASWDRNCPEFAKRCAWYDQKHPDNLLKFFPTDEDWTQELRPERIPFPERFPARFAVESLPPPSDKGKQREQPARQNSGNRNHAKPKGKGKRTAGQQDITHFFTPSQGPSVRTLAEEGEISERFLTPNHTGSFADSVGTPGLI
jgi:hypothetical protein